MKYISILMYILLFGLSVSAFAQDEVVQNAKITDEYPVEQTSHTNGFFKQASTLGLMPSYTIGGETFVNPERNFYPNLTLIYAGDLNGDGYDDFYYTVTTADETTDELDDMITKMVILYGTADGIDAENSVLLRDSYTFVADLDGDGQPESIQYKDGTLYVVLDESNGAMETLTEVDLIDTGYSGSYRAHGDFNGDGFDDLLVYASTVNPSQTRENYLIYGADNIANVTVDTLSYAASENASITEYYQMAYADVNNDGTTELIQVLSGRDVNNNVYGVINILNVTDTGGIELVAQDSLKEYFQNYFLMNSGRIALADLNGNGNQELLISANGNLDVFKLSDEEDSYFDIELPVQKYTINNFSILNDFDDDGSKELLIKSNDEDILVRIDSEYTSVETTLPKQDGDYLYLPVSFTENINSGGDVNGDGIADIVVGFYNNDSNRAGYRVHFGNSSGTLIDTTSTEVDIPSAENTTVRYVFNAGDFNSDGIDDFGITYTSNNVEVYFGGALSNEMAPNITIANDGTVYSPSIGDINGDGIDDLLITTGVSSADSNDAAIKIYLGGNSANNIPDYTIHYTNIYPDTTMGNLSNAQFIGDINNDGFDDIMFTSEAMQDVTHIMYGGTSLSATSDEQLPYFALNFSKLGDFNGDGLTEYAVANTDGTVFIYSGFDESDGGVFSDEPMLELPIPVYNGEDQFGVYAFYGHSITSGDFNGDSFADIAITSVLHREFIDGEYHSAEAIRIYAGGTSPDSLVDGKIYLKANDYALTPHLSELDTLERNIGMISMVPDQNNDGKDELLFAAYGWVTNAGVYYGSDLDTMGANIDVYLEAPNQSIGLGPWANWIYAGRGVPAVGDFNNDGRNEFILPQIGDRNFITDPVYIYNSDQFSVGNEEKLSAASEFKLHQNYPNPFNPTTRISYQLPVQSEVKLEVFDITGRLVSTVVKERQVAGSYTINFDASAFASGIYIYRLKAAGFTQTKKMTLIK